MSTSDWTVLVLGRIHQDGLDRLNAAEGINVVTRPDKPDDLEEVVSEADAIIVRITPITEAVVARAPKLKLVARHGVGYDAVDVEALSRRGIPLALVGDVNSGAVAEHTLALMLALAKQVGLQDAEMRKGNFAIRDAFAARELSGKTILVAGFGRIGRAVARLCQAFSMTVNVYDPYVPGDVIREAGFGHVPDFRAGLPEADWVTLHVPKTPETQSLLDAEALQMMKPGAMLINVARGGLVDEAALIGALESGHLAGAGLDVFEQEPLPADDPLTRSDKVLLTPHSGAFTEECVRRMAIICAENVLARRSGNLNPSLVVNAEVLGKATGGS